MSDNLAGVAGYAEGDDWLVVPNELKALLEIAKDLECKWITLDQDGDVVPELDFWIDGKQYLGTDQATGKLIV